MWCLKTFVEDATSAEAVALKNGLNLCGFVGCNRIIVESDCMKVIEVMKNGESSLGSVAAIYEECAFICRSFSHVSFSHCPREGSRAADSLASRAETVMFTSWQDEPPEFLFDVIMDDVNVFAKHKIAMMAFP
jgi:ribonuclease HI